MIVKRPLYFSFNNEQIPVEIKRSKRKSITISLHASGNILVKVPRYLLKRDIIMFINKKSPWIEKNLLPTRKELKQYDLSSGSKLPYLGREFYIRDDQSAKIVHNSNNHFYLPMSNKKQHIIKWYRDRAREKVTQLTDYYTDKMGIDYNKIFIKAQKTRWGSCSSRGNLNFNWKIILTPMTLIKYLVIHEVCHLIEMNHSSNFWKLVESYDPAYKKHKKELQTYGFYLRSFLE